MIRKFDEYINENLLDKMTSKSDDDIEKALKELTRNCEKLSDFVNWKSGELEEISELMETPLDEIYYINEESENFIGLHDYLVGILDKIPDYSDPIALKNTSNDGNQGYCFPKQKIAYWIFADYSEVVAWAFAKDVIKI